MSLHHETQNVDIVPTDPSIAPAVHSPVLGEKNSIQHEHAELTDEQAAHRLKLFRQAAENDPNLDVNALDTVDYAVDGHDVLKENELVDELLENSPYPEV